MLQINNMPANCVSRVDSLMSARFGYGAHTVGGALGEPTEIRSLVDSTLIDALLDSTPRYITFSPALDGQSWHLPDGSHQLGKYKTLDGRGSNVILQFGYENNDTAINAAPVRSPARIGRLVGTQGEFMMTGVRLRGDLGWPYAYEKPWFSNGATDGLEIWGGDNYFIYQNTFSRMSDESLSVFHNNGGTPSGITWAMNRFIQTKTGSIIGATVGDRGQITIAYNFYGDMVNGRAPGELRNMDAHVFNNVISYVNDEGLRVGVNGRAISEGNVFAMGCNTRVSGPRAVRYVLPEETPKGVLFSEHDIVDPESRSCAGTLDEGHITSPEPRPFDVPSSREYKNHPDLILTRREIVDFVTANAGAENAFVWNFC